MFTSAAPASPAFITKSSAEILSVAASVVALATATLAINRALATLMMEGSTNEQRLLLICERVTDEQVPPNE